jgi:hypothetical protein
MAGIGADEPISPFPAWRDLHPERTGPRRSGPAAGWVWWFWVSWFDSYLVQRINCKMPAIVPYSSLIF